MKLPLTLSLWGDLPYRVQIRKLQQKELNLSLLIFKKKNKKIAIYDTLHKYARI